MPPAPTRSAASILFVRDGAAGLEVFMGVRSHAVPVAPNALVFPGGKVIPEDRDYAHICPQAHLDHHHCSHAIAALREAFEEAGLLLAHDANGHQPDQELMKNMAPFRIDIERNQLSFAAFLDKNGLSLQLDQVHRFAHIVAPDHIQPRFDAEFYIAPAPLSHDAAVDCREMIQGFWASPGEILNTLHAQAHLMRPTRIVLSRLVQSASMAEALADAATFIPPRIKPEITDREGKTGLFTPEYDRFPASWEIL